MSFYRHEKEKLFIEKVFKRLDEKYDSNVSFYKNAEKDVIEQEKLIHKLKKASVFAQEIVLLNNEKEKHTIIDFNAKEVSLGYSNNYNSLLGYTLDFMSVRRNMPISMTELIDKTYHKDYVKLKEFNDKAKLARILQWVKLRSTWNIQLQNCSLNKKEGLLNYSTIVQEPNVGSFSQIITIVINREKKLDINGYPIAQYIKSASLDSNLLFNYFMLLGSSEIYSRCNCPEYNRKHSRKRGNANYFCNHLMFSMTQLPYYAYYLLANRTD